MPGAVLGQTITVVNKSGKVVSTSKHLVNVFKEAKSAYLERKAELKVARNKDLERKQSSKALAANQHSRGHNPPPSPRSLRSTSPTDDPSRKPSRKYDHGSHHDDPGKHKHHSRGSVSERRGSYKPSVERGYTDSFYVNDRPRKRSTVETPSPLKFMEDAERQAKGKELVRRRSLSDVHSPRSVESPPPQRSNSSIDMDLAYGELPPPLPSQGIEDQRELKVKVTALQRMLDEADCLQNSATAMIKSLENNPDAMAAVALTMAEISNIVAKLGPGALTALKGSFPAVVALLASPEFLIAAGVGVGITVIALGGYKIIKRIKAKKESGADVTKETESAADELEEIQSEVNLDRIELWRRGIADVEAESMGTSVEGEFITPGAAKDLREQGKLPPARSSTKKSSKEKRRAEKDKAEKVEREKEAKRAREKKEKQERRDKKDKEAKDRKERKRTAEMDKKQSGLALMFKSRKEDGYDKDLLN